MMKIERNELCPCGSGKKYKKCCLGKDIQKKIDKISKNPEEWIPMRIEDAKECEECFKRIPDAHPEDAECWRMKSDPIRIVCENFDNCLLVLAGQPNEPPECTDFYNEDMYKQFYDSKELYSKYNE